MTEARPRKQGGDARGSVDNGWLPTGTPSVSLLRASRQAVQLRRGVLVRPLVARSHRSRAGGALPPPAALASNDRRTRPQPPRPSCLAQSGSCRRRSLGCLGRSRRVLVVLADVRMIEESNRPDVAGADPALPYLVRPRAHGIVPRINRLTGREQGEMPVPWLTVIGEGV